MMISKNILNIDIRRKSIYPINNHRCKHSCYTNDKERTKVHSFKDVPY